MPFKMQGGLTRHRFSFNIRRWIPEKHQWLAAYEAIQEEERKRISQFVFKDDAKSSLIGRLLLRYMICQLTSISWKELFLKRSSKGKPIIDYSKSCEILHSYPDVSFNISHSGDYVIGVIDKTQVVGTDVMDIRGKQGDVAQFFGVMKRNFTPQEWACINKCSNDSGKMKLFYRHWCLKESFVKALGSGIGFSLQKLSFNVDSDYDTTPDHLFEMTTLNLDSKRMHNWHFEETMIDLNHCAAIATKIDDQKLRSDIASVSEHFTELQFCDFEKYLVSLSLVTDERWFEFDKKLQKRN